MFKIISRVFLILFILSSVSFFYSCNTNSVTPSSDMTDSNSNELSDVSQNQKDVADTNKVVWEDEFIDDIENPSDYVEITMVPIEYNGYEIMAIENTDPSLDEETVSLFQNTALKFLFALIDEDLDTLIDICTEDLYSRITLKDDNMAKMYYESFAGAKITEFENITPPIISKGLDNEKTISLNILFNTETSSRLVHFGLEFDVNLEIIKIKDFAL